MVSENLARELWGSASAAVGRRIRTLPDAPWREVIGVVQDVFENGAQEPAPSIVYWPALGPGLYRAGRVNAARTVTVAIRSERAGTESFVSEVKHAVWSVNASVPVASVRTMQEVYDRSMARTSLMMILLTIAGGMALLLSVVGLVGVVSYGVSQRKREIGIRVALGAQRGEVRRMFVRQGLALAAVGTAIGVVTAAGLTRWTSSLLFGVGALDPLTFLTVPFLLVVSAALASYFPARRAAAVDPAIAMRAE